MKYVLYTPHDLVLRFISSLKNQVKGYSGALAEPYTNILLPKNPFLGDVRGIFVLKLVALWLLRILLFQLSISLRRKTKLGAVYILTIFGCSHVFAEGLNISVNPLLTYHEQLKQLKQDCTILGFPPICEEKLKSITKEQAQLTDHCKSNFYDKRCQALKKKPKETSDRLDNFCSDNPNTPRCQKRGERKKYLQKYILKYCKTKPNSPRCRPRYVKPKKPSYMEVFCKEHAEEKRCLRFFERNGKSVPGSEEEGVNNLF